MMPFPRTLALLLLASAPARAADGLASYGYDPYEHHYGPIEAQRELDWLTYQPRVRGLDHGYGLDYWVGSRLPSRHGSHRPMEPGCIDSFYDAGYYTDGPCYGGFAISRGCTGGVPLTYRQFAPQALPPVDRSQVGRTWYEGSQPLYPALCRFGSDIDTGVTFGGEGEQSYIIPDVAPLPQPSDRPTAP